MTPEELLAAQKRDAATGDLWFTGPESFTALAARDRRALLAEVEALSIALDRIIGCARVEMVHHPINGLASEMYEIALAAHEKTT